MAKSKNKNEKSVTSKREKSRTNVKRRPAVNNRSSSSSSDKEDYSTSRSTSSSRSDRKIKNKRRDCSSSRSSTSSSRSTSSRRSSRSRSRSAKRSSRGSRSENKSKKEKITVPMKNKRETASTAKNPSSSQKICSKRHAASTTKQHSCSKSKANEIMYSNNLKPAGNPSTNNISSDDSVESIPNKPYVYNKDFDEDDDDLSSYSGNFQLKDIEVTLNGCDNYDKSFSFSKSLNATQSKNKEGSAADANIKNSTATKDANHQTLDNVGANCIPSRTDSVLQSIRARMKEREKAAREEYEAKLKQESSKKYVPNGTPTKDPNYQTLAGVAAEVFGGSGGSKFQKTELTGAKESLNATQSKKPESSASDVKKENGTSMKDVISFVPAWSRTPRTQSLLSVGPPVVSPAPDVAPMKLDITSPASPEGNKNDATLTPQKQKISTKKPAQLISIIEKKIDICKYDLTNAEITRTVAVNVECEINGVSHWLMTNYEIKSDAKKIDFVVEKFVCDGKTMWQASEEAAKKSPKTSEEAAPNSPNSKCKITRYASASAVKKDSPNPVDISK